MTRLFMSLTISIVLTSFVAAAEPPPAPLDPPLIETKLPIKASYPVKIQPIKAQQTEKATIHLPESVVRELAAKLNAKGASTLLPNSLGEESVPPSYSSQSSLPHGATIVAGCALSLAMLGFVLIRQRRPRVAILTGAAGIAVLVAVAASYLQANIAPPRRIEIAPPHASDKCLIVIVPDGGEVELFVPEK